MADGFFLSQYQPLDYQQSISGVSAPLSGLMGGVQSGLQIANTIQNMRAAQEDRALKMQAATQAQAAQEQEQALALQAAQGSPEAMAQLSAINPEAALQLQKISVAQQEQAIAADEAQKKEAGALGNLLTAGSKRMVDSTYERAVAKIRSEGDPETSIGLPSMDQWESMTPNAKYLALQDVGNQLKAYSGQAVGGKFGMTPVPLIGPSGEYAVGQLSQGGQLVPAQLPEGYKAAEPKKFLDIGPEYRIIGAKSGETQEALKKGLAPTERTDYIVEKKASEEKGKKVGAKRFDLAQTEDQGKYLLDVIDKQIKDPNVKDITGIYSLRPIIPGSSVNKAITRHDQIQAQAFLDVYSNYLRGGGQITEIEGEQGKQALIRAKRALTYEDYIDALKEFAGTVRKGLVRAKKQAGEAPKKEAAPNVSNLSDADLLQMLQ